MVNERRTVEAPCLAHTRLCVQSSVPQGPNKTLATYIFAKGKKYKFPHTYNCFQQTLPTHFSPRPPKEHELTFNQLPTIGASLSLDPGPPSYRAPLNPHASTMRGLRANEKWRLANLKFGFTFLRHLLQTPSG